MSKSHPIPMRGGLEQDALTGWRRVLHWRPGERKAAKTAYNRRVRRTLKKENE